MNASGADQEMDAAKFDRMVSEMNGLLERANKERYESSEAGAFPLLFIIGVPRSGTTLLSQLVSFYLDVSYVNNLVAAFWKAPLYGIALSKKLQGTRPRPSFESQFGRTQGVEQPHEFGYFWKDLFGYDMRFQPTEEVANDIDWDSVRKALRNIAQAYGSSVVFKYLPLCWHLKGLKSACPEALFLRVRRDPYESANSLLRFRVKEFGSSDYMASLIPTEMRSLEEQPSWVQVAAQVFHIEKTIDEQLAGIDPDAVLDLGYEEVCSNPRQTLERVAGLLAEVGHPVVIDPEPPNSFAISRRDTDSTTEAKIRGALEVFYGQIEPSR